MLCKSEVGEKTYRAAGGPSSHMFFEIMMASGETKADRRNRMTARRKGKKKEERERGEGGGWRSRIARQKIRGDRLSGARSYD